jgi:thiamine-monophosphate kinase
VLADGADARAAVDSAAGEFGRSHRSRITRGPGDDAAVVRARPLCVVSVDTVVEGTHFRLGEGWMTPDEVGARALGAALSDLAAMGAAPGEAYLALGLSPQLSEDEALVLVRGAHDLARANGTIIAGGDVVRSPVLSLSVTVVGWAEHERELVGREGARAGDLVGVTGTLGGAGAALAAREARASAETSDLPTLARAPLPTPRLAEGRALAAAGVHAMIDLSDGLATDAGHIARASGACLRLELERLPLGERVAETCRLLARDPYELAASAGEDYELCFCAPTALREAAEEAVAAAGATRVTWIGEVLDAAPHGAGVSLVAGNRREVRLDGFEHSWQ